MKLKCPLLKKECIEAKCMWWSEMTVKNLQTGEIAASKNCAISALPGLLVEVIRSTNGVHETIDKRGNEQVTRQDKLLNIVNDQRKRIANTARE